MNTQTRAAEVAQVAPPALSIDSHDREVLRRLAGRVAELAERPIEAENRRRWYRINALEDPGRPLVFCDPENGWNEIIAPGDLQCRSDLARGWEMGLRKEVFWGESMGDDRVTEAEFVVTHCLAEALDWGLRPELHRTAADGSYIWDAPIRSYDEDLPKLRFPSVRVDQAATDHVLALAQDAFAGVLEVRLKGRWWWSLGMTQTCAFLRGLEQMMLDMCLDPDGLKRLMAFFRDGTLAQLDDLERQGLLSLNNDSSYVGSGGFGYTHALPQPDFRGHVRTIDMWGFCESQETTQISPEQFEEFVFPYQLPVMERFGLTCYGCCEPIHLRWHVVKRFPRLRRLSVSPWCDLHFMAEALGDRYIFSMKPNPAALAVPHLDHDSVRRSLREAMAVTKGCRLEVIMKDNHTIGHNPQNVIDWCRIAREEAERIAGE